MSVFREFFVLLLIFVSTINSANCGDDGAEAIEVPLAVSDVRNKAIRSSFARMQAIAYSRAAYNRGWSKFLTEGRFCDADTEIVTDERKRLIYFIQNFSSKTCANAFIKASSEMSMSLLIRKLDNDCANMNRFAKCIEICGYVPDEQLQGAADKLFVFFHYSWCFREGESSKNREASEKYWMGVLRNILSPYASPSAALLKRFLVANDGALECHFFQQMEDDRSEMYECLKGIHRDCKACGSELVGVTHEDLLGHDGILREVVQIQTDVRAACDKLIFDSTRPLEFFKFWQENLRFIAERMLRSAQKSQHLKEVFKKASVQMRSARNAAAVAAKSQHSSRDSASAATVQANSKAIEATTEEPASVESLPVVEQQEDLVERPLADFLAQVNDPDESNADAVEADTSEVAISSDAECDSLTSLFRLPHVNYKALLRQINRDFKGRIFLAVKGSLTVLTLNHEGRLACAMYDTPHGAQLKKAYPHWRIAIQEMFERAGLGRVYAG